MQQVVDYFVGMTKGILDSYNFKEVGRYFELVADGVYQIVGAGFASQAPNEPVFGPVLRKSVCDHMGVSPDHLRYFKRTVTTNGTATTTCEPV